MKVLNNKGIGGGQVIIATAVLIFILLPIFTVIFEKMYVRIAIHNYEEVADMAVMSAVSQLNTKSLSNGQLQSKDIELIKQHVYSCISNYDNQTFSISTFRLAFYHRNEMCEYGFTSVYDFFHIVMKVNFKRIANSSDVKQITIHMDIEIPIDR